MTSAEFLKLIEKYGYECAAGGAGYTVTDQEKIFMEIVHAVHDQWREPERSKK